MTSQPVAGYPSKKHAVFAFLGQGKSDAEILLLTGTTSMAMAVYRSQHKLGKRGPADPNGPSGKFQARHKYHPRHEPALPPEQKVDEAEPARAGLVDAHMQHSEPEIPSFALSDDECLPATPPSPPKNEPEKPKVLISRLKPMAMEPMTGQCFLKNKATGAYLHYSCTIMTMEKAHRWRGTPQQAAVCRDRFPAAKDLTLINVTP